jgi:pyridoxine 5-phosphate synthase
MLSVNINKVALLRNSREGNFPNLLQYALDCEEYGADGITVHPRPDERHIRYSDIPILKASIATELNIEGNPIEKFMELVLKNKPAQCTLVPDDPNQLTSDHGWDTIKHKSFLTDICAQLKENGIRSSIFLDPDPKMLENCHEIGVDRIELYTGVYAKLFTKDETAALAELKMHSEVAKLAAKMGILVNAGHDLNLLNLKKYKEEVPQLKEVSIGHALTVDSIYFGLKNVISMYKNQLK